MSDLDMLKAIVDHESGELERFDSAEEAVANVLGVLYRTPSAKEMWLDVYDAIKSAYVGQADWGDEE